MSEKEITYNKYKIILNFHHMDRFYKPALKEKLKRMNRAEVIGCVILLSALLIVTALFLYAIVTYFSAIYFKSQQG